MRNTNSKLKKLQSIINEAKTKCGATIPVSVRLQPDFDDVEDPLFEIYCGDDLYSNFLSYDDARSTLLSIMKGLELASKISVCTTAGVLNAYKSTDPGQPGIVVMFQPSGYKAEVDASYVCVYEDRDYQTGDMEMPEDLCILTYGNIHDEEYTSKDIIRRKDIEDALAPDV